MREKLYPILAIMLAGAWVLVGSAAGQVASPADPAPSANSAGVSTGKPLPASASAASVPPAARFTSMQPDQPLSLGELARLARAKKTSQAKAVRIFDDENMPRAPVSAGQKAPDYSGHGGGSSAAGKVTVLDFWATWCGPCRHALPGLKQLQAAYGSQVEVVSISEDDDAAEWNAFVSQNGMNWTQKLDVNHQIMRQYGASALPTYVLIGKEGNVIQQYVGDDPDQPILERMGPELKQSL